MNANRCLPGFSMLLCLLLVSWVARAQPTVSLHDLTGTWTLPDGTLIAVVQRGNRVEARVQALLPQLINVFGWARDDPYFRGLITAGAFSGQVYVHFPVISKARCPNTAPQGTVLEFQIAGPNTLMGRARNLSLSQTDCTITTDARWTAIEFSRKKFDLADTSSEIAIKVHDGILFDFDDDRLKPDALAVLGEIKTLVIDQQQFARVLVGGHTDDRGSESHNEDLSTRRAQVVARWLSQNGVAKDLQAKGYGKREPTVPNTNDANRSRNRRVEIKLIK